MHKKAPKRRYVLLRRACQKTETITVKRPKRKPFVFPGRVLASVSGETLDCTIGKTNEHWFEINIYAHVVSPMVNPKRYFSPFGGYRGPHEVDGDPTRVVEIIYKRRSGKRVTEKRYVEVGENDLPGMCLDYFDPATQFNLQNPDAELIQRLTAQFQFLAADALDRY